MSPIKHTLLLITILLSIVEATSQTRIESEVNLTANDFDDRYASYSPDGRNIVFESNRAGNWHIYLMKADGSRQRPLTTQDGNHRRPSWHPSGDKVLFESDRSGKIELYTIDLKNLEIDRLTDIEEGIPMFAHYSPNGQSIVASIKESENTSNIVLIDTIGQIIKRLTDHKLKSYYPRWSNDGNEIVYHSRKDTENRDDEIYRLNIVTGAEHRLTDWPKHNFCPSWSSDNSKIVYVTSMEDLRPEIYVMDPDGENQLRITNNDDGDTLPCWSPTENKILITGYRNGNFEIIEFELNLQGP